MNHRRPNFDELTPEDLFRPEPPTGPGQMPGTIPGEVLHSSQEPIPWEGQGHQASGEPEYFGDPTGVLPLPAHGLPAHGLPAHGLPDPNSSGGEASTQFLPPFPAAPGADAPTALQQWQPQQPGYGGYQQQQQQPSYEPAPAQSGYAQPQYGQQQTYTQPLQQPQYGGQQTGGNGGQGGVRGGGSGARPGPGGRRISNRTIAAIAIAACAVIGIGAAAMFEGSDTPAQASTTASASASAAASGASNTQEKVQAQALSDLLATASNGRSAVITAVGNVKGCQSLGQSQQDLTTAAGLRQQLIQQLATLQTDALPNGTELVKVLREGWQASADADAHYAAWADQSKSSCAHKHQPKAGGELSQGDADSGMASADKAKASQLWNAIADATGMPRRSSIQL